MQDVKYIWELYMIQYKDHRLLIVGSDLSSSLSVGGTRQLLTISIGAE